MERVDLDDPGPCNRKTPRRAASRRLSVTPEGVGIVHTGFQATLAGDALGLVEALLPDGVTVHHRFEPHGVSVVRLGADGSVAVHTWPERGTATVDGYGGAARDLRARVTRAGWRVLDEERDRA